MSTAHSQQEDPNKPYWILRLVTEHGEADSFEVKKDTERADEIRAMKQAWESAEPGRAIKVTWVWKAGLLLSIPRHGPKEEPCWWNHTVSPLALVSGTVSDVD